MNIFVFFLWYLIGVASFVLWWTKENDLAVSDAIIGLIFGIYGPFVFIAGYFINGEDITFPERVIMKKRTK